MDWYGDYPSEEIIDPIGASLGSYRVIRGVSRLFRDSLSFSKKLDNHIDAIKYFICDYKLEIASLFSQFTALHFTHYQFS